MIQGFKKKPNSVFPIILLPCGYHNHQLLFQIFCVCAIRRAFRILRPKNFWNLVKVSWSPMYLPWICHLQSSSRWHLQATKIFLMFFVLRGKFRIVTLYFDKNSVNQTIVLQSLIDCTHVTLINDFPSCMFYSLTLILISKWNVLSVVWI